MDYTVHGILQARILEWVAVPFSRGSSQPTDQTRGSCIAGGFSTTEKPREQSRGGIFPYPVNSFNKEILLEILLCDFQAHWKIVDLDFVLQGLQRYTIQDWLNPPIWQNMEQRKLADDETFLVTQMVKHLPTMRETQIRSLGWEDPLEKEMATQSSTLAWIIPWTEERCRLQSMGSQRVGHD